MDKDFKKKLAEFDIEFEKELKPILSKFEKKRKIDLVVYSIFLPIILIPSLFAFFMGFRILVKPMDMPIYANVIIFAMMIFAGIYFAKPCFHEFEKANKKYKSIIKNECIGKLLSIFSDITWENRHSGIRRAKDVPECKSLENSDLFLLFNYIEEDDVFKGSHQGVDYKISELKLYDSHDHERGDCGIFGGIVINFKCNKKIKNKTIVSTKFNLTKRNSSLYYAIIMAFLVLVLVFAKISQNILIILAIATTVGIIEYFSNKKHLDKQKALNKVILEDSTFNKRFDVYSSNQIEARYLLTPTFMERLYNLQTNFGAKTVKCSFYKDSLMIAISTHQDLFEFGSIYKSPLNKKSYEKLFNDLYSILNLIEYFKLDEKTGL